MAQPYENLAYFGTAEPSQVTREFAAGPLTLSLSDGAIRHLCWHGIEVVRGIACPIRDANWATHASVLTGESVTSTPDAFEVTQVRLVADGALRVTLVFKGSSDGTFVARAEMSACRDVITNRAGFTLLHPLRDVAGTPLRVIHPDGSDTASQFPLLISPDQVASDMVGLRHSVSGIETEILFRGEVFEMEDQRNWSDASFKTYCRPLSLPRPYRLLAGDIQRQEIQIRVREAASRKPVAANASRPAVLEFKGGAGNVPHLAVATEEGAIPQDASRLYRLLSPAILQLRVTPQTAPILCENAKAIIAASHAEVELEIVIPATDEPHAALAHVAATCKNSALAVARVLALPERYLHSYQPSDPWPAGPTPQDLWKHARASFPDAQIGGGGLTYFTELNRCRPAAMCDYIGHGSTAVTHAADDCSVMESLEGLAHVFKSGRALAGERDYRLGLVAIGMRSNPYGSGVVENLQQNRIAMAGADPRQRGLFAAAWAVGAVAATEGHGVSSMALSAFVGPFGVIHRPEAWMQPLYEGADMVYPLLHVVRFMSRMGGAPRLLMRSAGNGIVGVASQDRSDIRLIIANLGTDVSHVRLPHAAETRSLNTDSFQSAIHDPRWLDTSEPNHGSIVALTPLSVAFVRMVV